jgi:uncharacterized membrane protein
MSHPLSLAAFGREYLPDAIAFTLSVALVAVYYLYLRHRAALDPTYSVHGVNAKARRLWTESVMAGPGKDVMAVQTLRNFIMVGIMMASTASVLIIGTLTLSGQAQAIIRNWDALALLGSQSTHLWILKVILLLVDFIVAFFAYALSMRLATHVLFMINVPPAGYRDHPELGPQCVGNTLVRAGSFIAIGMRAFLFAIPLVFWLFGALFLVLATIGLVATLYRLDRNEAADNLTTNPRCAPLAGPGPAARLRPWPPSGIGSEGPRSARRAVRDAAKARLRREYI